ncbi:class I SAM-dependent methyltransferase [Pedobacter sp. MC2016-15]|uniref:class I SAM-dependent methyltransferase n=1 Tax=Pedobacter sp. MC2016-15 TaxID=2994473 RepID=UPI002245666A|nr:class I SAM-dependent methyltransferase [Pedobacter sp. MC2016-15]MCX2481726.1 class I SAM-dependent methyltransferase [Pedobacter sp. MC2016-15]
MLSNDVKSAYNDFYTKDDSEWRMLGAKSKAANIVAVCKSIKPVKVLEVGAGDGSILHFLNEWNFGEQLYALEIADTGVSRIRERGLDRLAEARSFDGYEIPYPDDSFDLVILSHVLEHVEHERILIRELKRIAKNIVVEVPLDYRFGVDKRMKHFLDYGHINMYTPTSLRFLLQSEGLKVVADTLSMTPPATTKFNEFVNKKAPKAFSKIMKIEMEYRIKKVIGSIMGIRKEEQFANAYTVLTQKSNQTLQIF